MKGRSSILGKRGASGGHPNAASDMVRDALEAFAAANGFEIGKVVLWEDQPLDLPVVDRCQRFDH